MVAGWRRVAAGVGFALCGLLLAGCRAEGTLDVLSEERVAVDLVVSSPEVECTDAVYGLTLRAAAVTDASGLPACRFFGESRADALHQFGIYISTAAEYLVLQTNLSLGFSELPATDVKVRFPGQVVTATKGTVIGNAVDITDLAPLTQGSGLRVVGLRRPGPPAWMTAAAIGAGSGVAGTGLILVLVWRARRRRLSGSDLIAPEPAEVPGTVKGSFVAADSNGREVVSGLPPPPAADPAAVVDESTDNAWFAAPPPVSTVPPDTADTASSLTPAVADGLPAAPATVEPPDRTVWAPPEDRT